MERIIKEFEAVDTLLQIFLKNKQKESALYNYVIEDILEYDTDDEMLEYMNDVLRIGCVSGIVGSLIYKDDTKKFFIEYMEDIFKLYNERNQEYPIQFELTADNLAWYGYEEVVRKIREEFEEEQYSDLILDEYIEKLSVVNEKIILKRIEEEAEAVSITEKEKEAINNYLIEVIDGYMRALQRGTDGALEHVEVIHSMLLNDVFFNVIIVNNKFVTIDELAEAKAKELKG